MTESNCVIYYAEWCAKAYKSYAIKLLLLIQICLIFLINIFNADRKNGDICMTASEIGTGKNGTGNKSTNGKVKKHGTLMLNFTTPQT